jgi:c-di-GMP-binding flagellar brake protein YcgR
MDELRKYYRCDDSLEVEYDFEDRILGLWVSSKTKTFNISEGGVALPLSRIIKPGATIHIKIRLSESDKEITALGKVVWKRPAEETHTESLGELSGVRFTSIFKNDEETLKEFMMSEKEKAIKN